jgi:HemY protein
VAPLRRERAAQAALREALSEYFGARYGRAHKAAQRALAISTTRGTCRTTMSSARWPACWPPAACTACRTAGAATKQLHRGAEGRAARHQPVVDAAPAAGGRMGPGRPRCTPRAGALLAALPPGVARRTQALRLKLQAARMARQPLDALHTARLLAKHQAFSPLVAQACCGRWW